jgi:peroxiredoxin
VLKHFCKTVELRSVFTAIAVFIIIISGLAQKNAGKAGYKIKGEISGITDTVCYLAHYYGDKTYMTDTARADSKGRIVFEGDSVLPGGIYIVAGQKNNKYLEIIVDKDQHFSFRAALPDVSENITFEDSPENTLFFEFINENMRIRKQIEQFKADKAQMKANQDSLAIISRKIDLLDQEIEKYQDNLIESHPGSFVSVMIRATKEPETGKIPVLENGRQDSAFAFRQYKQHYWDNFDLTDERLLRTPLFHKRLDKYFKDLVYQRPDSINHEADLLIGKVRSNPEVFKYLVWFLTYKYETSKIMGFDEIFVHMVDSYYASGEAYWTDTSTLKTLVKRADALRPILIGKKAPELILFDTSGSFLSLHHTPAKFLVLIFYESDCSHCKKEIKELNDWYKETETGTQVFAVCIDTSLVKWKKFVLENDLKWVNVNGTRSITRDYHDLYDISMTPTMFVLDENKYIIAKRLKAEQLKSFLTNYINNPNLQIKD